MAADHHTLQHNHRLLRPRYHHPQHLQIYQYSKDTEVHEHGYVIDKGFGDLRTVRIENKPSANEGELTTTLCTMRRLGVGILHLNNSH